MLLSDVVLVTRTIVTEREGGALLLGAADEDHEEARTSLAKLDGFGTLTRLPGHGKPWNEDIGSASEVARDARLAGARFQMSSATSQQQVR